MARAHLALWSGSSSPAVRCRFTAGLVSVGLRFAAPTFPRVDTIVMRMMDGIIGDSRRFLLFVRGGFALVFFGLIGLGERAGRDRDRRDHHPRDFPRVHPGWCGARWCCRLRELPYVDARLRSSGTRLAKDPAPSANNHAEPTTSAR